MIRFQTIACGAAGLLLLIAGAGVSHADTITQTGTFNDLSAGNSYSSSDGGGGGFMLPSESITGVGKFDPALGTLTAINLFAEFDAELMIDVYASGVFDDSEPHSVDFDANFVQFFIGYQPTGSGSIFVLPNVTFPASASCFGDSFEGDCTDTAFDGDSVADGTDLMGLGALVLADFVGVGDVDRLSAFIAVPVPGAGMFTLNNVDMGDADLFADMYYTSLTVEYVFTPIPEPVTLSLLAIGGLCAIRRRR